SMPNAALAAMAFHRRFRRPAVRFCGAVPRPKIALVVAEDQAHPPFAFRVRGAARIMNLLDQCASRINLTTPHLVEEAIARGEAELTADGALAADTGRHTGRSPKDKFIVRDALTDKTVWWENSASITPDQFDIL